ncbi:unnamed protein product [Rotaria sp. Silwood2]|nr:unnamed protein product [Rotaria sp. Silwood2]CAF2540782.1 unnamed protein product [Rotaria sp. Silwood2]CAF2776615.1 unnamed protein product [Rotaria sp. Silwood2]CAF3936138.1 unnamed protein product [Rotaria sp. Silwood2]CAF4064515.1 unnamed protein product [Rotaria sp. Silwood2]
MSYQKVQNFKCRCPLIQTGIYGLTESHQIPNIPCDRSSNDVFLNQHLQWYHNFDSVSARKLVRAIFNNINQNEHLFSIYERVLKQNISVENYKCKCPLTQDGVFGLSDEHDITNIPCGRAEKEVLCFQHLQFHHNLSSRAAKKIVLALVSYTPTITRLFHNNDHITQSKCAVRKLKSKCPLLSRHIYGNKNNIFLSLSDQHHVPNIPCDRADQHIFLFHHLTYFHKLNAKAATKLIRALIINKDPCEALFHSNDIIVVSNQTIHNQQYKTKRSKKMIPQEKNYSDTILDFSTHYQSLLNAINTSMTKTTNDTLDNSMMPLDCSKSNQPSYQLSYPYSTNNMAHVHGLDLNSFLT